MLKRTVTCLLALLLVSCGVPPPAAPSDPPPVAAEPTVSDTAAKLDETKSVVERLLAAPPDTLNKTQIDDQGIRLAFETFDVALSMIDTLVVFGKLERNSPKALAVRRYVLATRDWLNAASAFQRAGSATRYSEALREAAKGLASARSALTQ